MMEDEPPMLLSPCNSVNSRQGRQAFKKGHYFYDNQRCIIKE
jgi:hypothetical protein